MDSYKHTTEKKGKEQETNPENLMVNSEILVNDGDSQQDERQETQSVSNEPDSLITAGNYVYILEGKIGRIDLQESPKNIIGLYTDNFTTCNILVMFSKDRRRYVLAHMDLSLKEPVIKKQIEWLGGEPSLFRIYRKDYTSDSIRPEYVAARCLPCLQNKFITIEVDDKIESVSISYADNEPILSSNKPARVQSHPKSMLLAVQHSMTGLTGNIGFLSPLMFDGKQWVNYDKVKLSNQSIKYIQSYLGEFTRHLFEAPLVAIDSLLTSQFNVRASREPINIVSYFYLYFQYASLSQLTKSAFLAKMVEDFLIVFSGYETCHFTEIGHKYLDYIKNASTYPELKDLVMRFDTEEMINIIYSELLAEPKYKQKSDNEKKRIALVQRDTLAQCFKLTTVCFEFLFHRFLSIETIPQEKQVMPKSWATHFQGVEQQRGESSGSNEEKLNESSSSSSSGMQLNNV